MTGVQQQLIWIDAPVRLQRLLQGSLEKMHDLANSAALCKLAEKLGIAFSEDFARGIDGYAAPNPAQDTALESIQNR